MHSHGDRRNEGICMSELYELPDGWEWKEWKNIVNVKNGKHYKDVLNPDGQYPIYGSGGIMNYANEYLCNEDTVVIGRKGTINSPILVREKFWNIDTAFGLEANRDSLNPFFLYYFSMHFNFLDLNKSTTLPSLAKSNLQKILMPLPPLPEQKRIVSKLDTLFEKIDKAIALHQKNMDEADVFMGSVLNDIFGELEGKYGKRTLESFNKKMSSGGTPSRKEKAYWNGTIEWFSSGELNQLYTLPSKERITQVGLDNTSAKLFSKGTLLVGMYDTAAMKMSILSNDGSCNQAIVGFKPNEDELNIFFTKYQLEYLKKSILEQRQGVRQKNLNLSKIKNVQIEYPPLSIQQKTVKYLDQISEKTEKVKSVQKEKMESFKALKASLLDRAFRGKV